jgi:4-hydroxy-3-methylbut-2-enyl diphosphate reductase IspH
MENKLQFTGENSHHGDVQLFSISQLPAGVKKVENRLIAKSEKSGHSHVLCGDYDMYEKEGVDGVFVVVGEKGATLNHAMSSKLNTKVMATNAATEVADHQPNFYKAGDTMFIGIQQRKKHFSKVWAKVKD